MKNLNAKACLALAVLVGVMGLLLFVPAGTVHYWQAWVYLSIFTGASLLITLYLMKKDPSLLERRMSGGPTAEKQPAQKVIMTGTSLGFIALLVVPTLDYRFGWSAVPLGGVVAGDVLVAMGFLSHLPRVSREYLHVSNHRSHRRPEGHFDRAVRYRAPSDVRECVTVPSWHAAGARLVVGIRPDRRDDAISDLAPH
jgi:hypothetical protein